MKGRVRNAAALETVKFSGFLFDAFEGWGRELFLFLNLLCSSCKTRKFESVGVVDEHWLLCWIQLLPAAVVWCCANLGADVCSCRLARSTPPLCWISCAATVCWRVSVSAARDSPTASSSRSSVSATRSSPPMPSHVASWTARRRWRKWCVCPAGISSLSLQGGGGDTSRFLVWQWTKWLAVVIVGIDLLYTWANFYWSLLMICVCVTGLNDYQCTFWVSTYHRTCWLPVCHRICWLSV